MHNLVFILCLVLSFSSFTKENNASNKQKKQDLETTYYLIRHAEKDRSAGANPDLLPEGKKRANYWSKVLKDKNIDLVYSTNYNRTIQTATPLADEIGTSVKVYDKNNMYSKQFQKETQGKTVLIVGHQDTTPKFANLILGKKKFRYIPANNNSNLYTIIKNGENVTGKVERFDVD